VLPTYGRAALPVAASSISAAESRRLTMIGAAIGLAGVAACALLDVVVCAAVFS
jgi:uncharacterized membrane protein